MGNIPIHTRNASMIAKKISSLGVTDELQGKIGLFAVSWGLFESNLEQAVWMLKREEVEGKRPSTDKSPASTWIVILSEGREDFSNFANDVLKLAAAAARDYRHSLFHGYLAPFPGAVSFMRNPEWNGEIRNRSFGDAHIDESLLDMAIDSAWCLFRLITCVISIDKQPEQIFRLEEMKPEIVRITNLAHELRYLSDVMNDEKY